MFDLVGTRMSDSEHELLCHPAAGGLILFSRNYESPDQLMALVAEVRDLRPDILIAVDHEGGRVQRFRTGFTRLPPAAAYLNADGETGLAAAATAGWLMAAELRAVGVDFSFAPVLDVDSGVSAIIGDRAFARTPEEVTAVARAFTAGMRRAGMAAVGKHFPGHGGVADDSHLTLPEDRREFEELLARDLLPFSTLISEGLEGIMPAHVLYPRIDTHTPCFSHFWLQTILRERMNFDGAIFSDDLSMAGAARAGDYPTRALAALDAGCDMLVVCNNPEATTAILQALENRPASPGGARRLSAMHGRFPIDRGELLASTDWRNAVDRIRSLTGSAQ
ncbi:beta-N-acetylhexosaminidase [Methylococcus capsulatus]|uniref:Beta-hexosaminidase n=2 Tax=Methylococcaceae TaxID=403 RepID=A0ABZ2F8W8_METCP|nr:MULTISPECIES: beta-N-acetylhexosaminidase [Methylococcus]MDF9393105.1 beta-N-acetylhexosaminidase [Methylococcus capsulatus]